MMSNKADEFGRLPLSEQRHLWQNEGPGDVVGWYPLNRDQFELLQNHEDADVRKLRIGGYTTSTLTAMTLDNCLQSLIRELEHNRSRMTPEGITRLDIPNEDLSILAQIMHAQVANYTNLMLAQVLSEIELDRGLRRMQKAQDAEDRRARKKKK